MRIAQFKGEQQSNERQIYRHDQSAAVHFIAFARAGGGCDFSVGRRAGHDRLPLRRRPERVLPCGKLGNNTTTGRSLVPVEVHGAANVDYLHSVMAIMGGETHNMALKYDGTLWSWGYNFVGELGDGTTNDAATPVQVGLNSVPPLMNVPNSAGPLISVWR